MDKHGKTDKQVSQRANDGGQIDGTRQMDRQTDRQTDMLCEGKLPDLEQQCHAYLREVRKILPEQSSASVSSYSFKTVQIRNDPILQANNKARLWLLHLHIKKKLLGSCTEPNTLMWSEISLSDVR